MTLLRLSPSGKLIEGTAIGQALVWNGTEWIPTVLAPGGSQTLAETLALGADANSIEITNLGAPTAPTSAARLVDIPPAPAAPSFCNSFYFGSNLPVNTPIALIPLDGGGSYPADGGTALTRGANNVTVNESGLYTLSFQCAGRVTAGSLDDVWAGCEVTVNGTSTLIAWERTYTDGVITGVVYTATMAATVYLEAGWVLDVRPTLNGWTVAAGSMLQNIFSVYKEVSVTP